MEETLSILVLLLFIYSIYALIEWFRNSRKAVKSVVAPHKRIARLIWGYCVLLISVSIIMFNYTNFNQERFYHPIKDSRNWYDPNGHYSYLNIGGVDCIVEGGRRLNATFKPVFMGYCWEELDNETPTSPYKNILGAYHKYDSYRDSKSYGRGIVLRVYDLDNDILYAPEDESLAYRKIISSLVSDSSFYQLSKNFAPYTAIETPTYAIVSEDGECPPIVKKHITIFANDRAYELNFYVDTKKEVPDDTNMLDYLDAEFNVVAKRLDLHSYGEWQESHRKWQKQESQYRNKLNIKCGIFIALYIICILGAIYIAFRYYKNVGNINLKAAKILKIMTIVNFVTFAILGISFAAAYCSIHYEDINGSYPDRFPEYINGEYAAMSVLCYGVYFLLFIIPTNRYYIKSYTQPRQNKNIPKSKHGLIYWLVRPVVIISRFFSKSIKALREEYNRQISDKN